MVRRNIDYKILYNLLVSFSLFFRYFRGLSKGELLVSYVHECWQTILKICPVVTKSSNMCEYTRAYLDPQLKVTARLLLV